MVEKDIIAQIAGELAVVKRLDCPHFNAEFAKRLKPLVEKLNDPQNANYWRKELKVYLDWAEICDFMRKSGKSEEGDEELYEIIKDLAAEKKNIQNLSSRSQQHQIKLARELLGMPAESVQESQSAVPFLPIKPAGISTEKHEKFCRAARTLSANGKWFSQKELKEESGIWTDVGSKWCKLNYPQFLEKRGRTSRDTTWRVKS